MISLSVIRQNPEIVKEGVNKKGSTVSVSEILDLDGKNRTLQYRIGKMRAERNRVSEAIGNAKRKNENADQAIESMRQLGDALKSIESESRTIKTALNALLNQIPNLPHESVPSGNDDNGNVIVREWGDIPDFDYQPRKHTTLGESLELFDMVRGSKISGSGFPLYIGKGAALERKLINVMLDHHIRKYNFTEIYPPVLMLEESMRTTGQLPKFEEEMYHTELDHLYLAPTAEVPVTNIHRNEILNEDDLPINYVAYSPCFRRESGSYGKDTRGLLRIHQFNKVELVKFTTPESSYRELESLTMQAESVLQALQLTYRVVELCTGDLSFAAAKCFDLEVWAPGEMKWLEVSSCSNFEDFQARRGQIRYRSNSNKKVSYVHTLNGSGLATPRLMVALLETYQNEDGNIKFPDPVSDFLGIKGIS
ncbi:MAG: serine--tRNA ligase [Candidatus Neomarinimicrobiota bacterium]|nr:serine--tRNA ligase [Candidatus Neomarinimicrobiota bacterium]